MGFNSFDAANIVMHIVLISTFITIFFFTYGTMMEKKILKEQIRYVLDDVNKDLEIKEIFEDSFKNIIPDDIKTNPQIKEQINMLADKLKSMKQNTLETSVQEASISESVQEEHISDLVGFIDLDKQTHENNNKIMEKASSSMCYSLVCGVIIFILIAMLMRPRVRDFMKRPALRPLVKNKTDTQLDDKIDASTFIGSIMGQNILMIIIVAITEFTFLTYLGSKIIYVDTNNIKRSALEFIRNL